MNCSRHQESIAKLSQRLNADKNSNKVKHYAVRDTTSNISVGDKYRLNDMLSLPPRFCLDQDYYSISGRKPNLRFKKTLTYSLKLSKHFVQECQDCHGLRS